MAAKFDTSEFVRANWGRRPRGEGCWAFKPNGSENMDDWMFSPCMSFAEAKRWAQQQRPDVRRFVVGS